MSLGLAAALSQGLSEGVKGFIDIQNQRKLVDAQVQDRAIKEKLANAQQLSAIAHIADVGGIGEGSIGEEYIKASGLLPKMFKDREEPIPLQQRPRLMRSPDNLVHQQEQPEGLVVESLSPSGLVQGQRVIPNQVRMQAAAPRQEEGLLRSEEQLKPHQMSPLERNRYFARLPGPERKAQQAAYASHIDPKFRRSLEKEYRSAPLTIARNEAVLNVDKALRDLKSRDPVAQRGAILNVLRAINPGQAIHENALKHLNHSPEWLGNFEKWIHEGVSGRLPPELQKSIERTALSAGLGAIESHKLTRQTYKETAQREGLGTEFTDDKHYDAIEKKWENRLKELGDYQPAQNRLEKWVDSKYPGLGKAASQISTGASAWSNLVPGLLGGVARKFTGLIH